MISVKFVQTKYNKYFNKVSFMDDFYLQIFNFDVLKIIDFHILRHTLI